MSVFYSITFILKLYFFWCYFSYTEPNNFKNKKAYHKFLELISYQHGDINRLPKAKNVYHLKARKTGYLANVDVVKLASLCKYLGAGRMSYDDKIDYSAGIILNKSINDYVKDFQI